MIRFAGFAICALLAATTAVGVPPAQAPASAPDHVAITVAASRDTISPGAGSEIVVTFTPRMGYHVNAVPPMSVKLDSGVPASATGKIVIPSDTATGYLKASLPVRQPITLSGSAVRGRLELKGMLTYYYCSDAEGWCRKEQLRFGLPVTVR